MTARIVLMVMVATLLALGVGTRPAPAGAVKVQSDPGPTPREILVEVDQLLVDGDRLYVAATWCRVALYTYRLSPGTAPRSSAQLHEPTPCGYGTALLPAQESLYALDDEYGLRTYRYEPARTYFLPGAANHR